ncbi:hypothetical protein E2C01_079561 [Portunus trituberculatus]|uniref:Uncharacterized protein n=1 Tax=Portunus trituberculatus TaxID=210409 RepID=A0A5B7IH83_PORTR|nr:hypothetical protein [Portunus trituberculatus]
MYFYDSTGSGKISTLLPGETLLKTPLIILVALENSHGEREREKNYFQGIFTILQPVARFLHYYLEKHS